MCSTRTANSLSGRLRLNYQYSAATQMQMALMMMGKTLSGQGYRSPNRTLNLSARHALTSQLSLVANVTDVLDKNKMETVIDSSTLRETSTTSLWIMPASPTIERPGSMITSGMWLPKCRTRARCVSTCWRAIESCLNNVS